MRDLEGTEEGRSGDGHGAYWRVCLGNVTNGYKLRERVVQGTISEKLQSIHGGSQETWGVE